MNECMRQTALVLSMMAKLVQSDNAGMNLTDRIDFAMWLEHCAKQLELSTSMEDFVLRIR